VTRKQRPSKFVARLGDVTIIPPGGTVSKKIPATTNGKAARGLVIRVATIKNPRTGKTILVRVTTDGRLDKRTAAHLGIKRASSWVEVATARWAVATKLARAGKGRRVRAA